MVLSVATEKIPSDTPGIDPETVRLVAQCLGTKAKKIKTDLKKKMVEVVEWIGLVQDMAEWRFL